MEEFKHGWHHDQTFRINIKSVFCVSSTIMYDLNFYVKTCSLDMAIQFLHNKSQGHTIVYKV